MKRLFIIFIIINFANGVFSSDLKPYKLRSSHTLFGDTSIFSFNTNNYSKTTDFSNIGLDSTAQQLFDNNPIFYTNWDNEKLFVYGPGDVEDLPEIIDLKLLQGDEKFTLTYHNGISSGYGYRWGARHEGLDLPLRTGDSVVAAFDGIVRYARYTNSGYGNCIIIRHLNGLETLYGHLSSINVLENQFLKSGELIGLGGSTGRSTGPHLHFETRLNGQSFNPKLIINIEEKSLYADSISFPKSVLFGKHFYSNPIPQPKYNFSHKKTVSIKTKSKNKLTALNKKNNKKIKAVKKNDSKKHNKKEVKKNKTTAKKNTTKSKNKSGKSVKPVKKSGKKKKNHS